MISPKAHFLMHKTGFKITGTVIILSKMEMDA